MKYKVWKQHKNASAPGEVGGLLRFSSRPRGGWFVWVLRPERQQQQRRQPQRQQRPVWRQEIQPKYNIPLDLSNGRRT